jgi:molecular chaperone GrpE
MNSDGSIDGAENRAEGAEEVTPSAGTPRPPSPLEEAQAKLQEAEKKYLYLYSEFENFRRRNERDRLEFLKFGHESFLKELLQVMDNFERALAHAKSLGGEKGSPVVQVVQGIEMIHYQFLEALKGQGVSPVASAGQKFDPALHEAVGEEEAKAEPGTVVKEMQKGYLLHGRLLRPARVVLAKPGADAKKP